MGHASAASAVRPSALMRSHERMHAGLSASLGSALRVQWLLVDRPLGITYLGVCNVQDTCNATLRTETGVGGYARAVGWTGSLGRYSNKGVVSQYGRQGGEAGDMKEVVKVWGRLCRVQSAKCRLVALIKAFSKLAGSGSSYV